MFKYLQTDSKEYILILGVEEEFYKNIIEQIPNLLGEYNTSQHEVLKYSSAVQFKGQKSTNNLYIFYKINLPTDVTNDIRKKIILNIQHVYYCKLFISSSFPVSFDDISNMKTNINNVNITDQDNTSSNSPTSEDISSQVE